MTRNFGRLGAFASASAIALCIGSAPVHAQTQTSPGAGTAPASSNPATSSLTTPQGAPSPAGTAIEEVVVTAQRRSENLEKTPVAVSVLTSAGLVKQAVKSDADLQISVPGLLVRSTEGSNDLTYSIRGQSVDTLSNSQPAVLAYVDEVQTTTGSASAFYDLQSIQVLKGPQGTLFGRNSTGGAVLFTTNKPTNAFGGYVTVQGGDYNLVSVQGAVNVPIVDDKVLLRVAGFYENRGGFDYNSYDGSHPGDVVEDAGRISLLLKPIEKLKNTLVVDFLHSGGTNLPQVLYSLNEPGSTNNGVPLNATAASLYSPAFGPVWTAYLAAHPKAYAAGLTAFLSQQHQVGPYDVDIDDSLSHKADNLLVSNVTTYDLAANTQIKNIVGFGREVSGDDISTSGTPYIIENGFARFKHTDYSEELQLLGKALSGQLNYVAGFYFSDNSVFTQNNVSAVDLSPDIPPTNFIYSADQDDRSYAGYVQGTYDLSALTGIRGLGATAGVRYTEERVTQDQLPPSAVYNYPGGDNHLSTSFGKLSWQVGVQEQLNSNLLLYVVSRHSFRSGGFNVDSPPVPGDAETGGAGFRPETATDVEVGEKYQDVIASMPVRLNVAAYDEWIDNVQRSDYVQLPGGTVALTFNVPKAEVSGFEADGQISPFKWLNLGASTAFTDARFTDGKSVIENMATNYGPFSNAPKWSGSAFAETNTALGQDIGVLSLRGDLFAESDFFFGTLNNTVNPGTRIPGYALVNFRASIENVMNTHVTLAAYVKNALDKGYFSGGQALGSALGYNAADPGAPRTYFFEATYKF